MKSRRSYMLLAISGAVSLFGGIWGISYIGYSTLFPLDKWWGFPLWMTFSIPWGLGSCAAIVTGAFGYMDRFSRKCR